MSYKSCFLTDTFILHEVKKKLLVTDVLKLFLFLLFLFMNILTDNLFMQFFYIQNRKVCLSKKILYHYFAVVFFFALLGTNSPLKTFYMLLYNMKNLKKI